MTSQSGPRFTPSFFPWRSLLPSAPDPFEPASVPYLILTSPVKLLLYNLHALFTSLRSLPSPPPNAVRVVCISDTHEQTCEVPEGDVLIHAGDMTNIGSVQGIQKQVDWLNRLPHKHIVVIAGNHDTYLDPRTRPSLSRDHRTGTINWGRVHYLQHCSVTLSISIPPKRPSSSASSSSYSSRDGLLPSSQAGTTRKLRVYGAPQIPACGPMPVHAFQYPRGADAWSETVPDDTDILVTHTPPKYHLDLSLPEGLGCEHLAAEVKRVKPVLHVFGHVHWGAGKRVCWWNGVEEAYDRGMSARQRWFGGLLNPKIWWSCVKVVLFGLTELAWDKIWGGQGQRTIMVNAAQMKGNTGKVGNAVQVVDI